MLVSMQRLDQVRPFPNVIHPCLHLPGRKGVVACDRAEPRQLSPSLLQGGAPVHLLEPGLTSNKVVGLVFGPRYV